tara:strand:- start:1988 stop:2299 length:312 start_codon:yes stop_codon:yes gene_type:complete
MKSFFKNLTQKNLYHVSYIIYYVIYILSLIGFSFIAPVYLDYFTSAIQIYIGFVLLWRFNPLRKDKECTKYDKELIFSCALFLLFTTTIGQIVNSFIQNKYSL